MDTCAQVACDSDIHCHKNIRFPEREKDGCCAQNGHFGLCTELVDDADAASCWYVEHRKPRRAN